MRLGDWKEGLSMSLKSSHHLECGHSLKRDPLDLSCHLLSERGEQVLLVPTAHQGGWVSGQQATACGPDMVCYLLVNRL